MHPAPEHQSDPVPVSEPGSGDVAECPGTTRVDHEHADELADGWGKDSFPASDPPAHY